MLSYYTFCRRVLTLLEPVRDKVVVGGESDPSERYIAPTIVDNASTDDSVMTNEIFGPVLPIVPVENVQKAIEFVNQRYCIFINLLLTSSDYTYVEIGHL